MPYATLTLATLRGLLQNTYTDDPFWSDTEANDALNEALRQFNLYTGYWRGTVTALTTANVAFVTVPARSFFALTMETDRRRPGNGLQEKSGKSLHGSGGGATLRP